MGAGSLILVASSCAQVEWTNPADPSKGFRYMYLSEADYAAVSARADTAVLEAIPIVAESGARTGIMDHVPC